MVVELQTACRVTRRATTGAPHSARRQAGAGGPTPYFVYHPSFRITTAEHEYGVATTPPDTPSSSSSHMPDEVTRDLAGRMHYAAYRWQEAVTPKEGRLWRCRYYALRDRIILGNRKLIFRAANQGARNGVQSEDLVGDCDIVLIQAVAAYNPWLGVRFSTYAFTCLMRGVARQRSRWAPAQSLLSLSSGVADDYSLARFVADDPPRLGDSWQPVLRHFRKEDRLLSEREKVILERRYQLAGEVEKPTLEEVGHDLGISKERVRQLQNSALGKLRRALLATSAPARGTAS